MTTWDVQNEKPLFENAEIISSYTDGEAVADGILVAVTKQDRVTRSVWSWMTAKTPADPPNCWPVDLMGWISTPTKKQALALLAKYGADDGQKRLNQMIRDKALAMSRGLLGTHAGAARRTYEQNTDGGIYKLFAVEQNGVIAGLESKPTPGAVVLWIMPNENQGVTLMFPEDY
jgi:hypothetical protein